MARLILSLHWFNPFAWLSARRFDEAAEWACDALLAREQPARATQLANALLAATSVRDDASVLSLSATGGPLFQRIRRLVSWDQQRDSVALRCVWTGILFPLMLLGQFQLKFADSISAQVIAQTTLDEPQTSSEAASPSSEDSAQSLELDDIANRILVGDNDKLKRVVALMKTPIGQIVMADRAAVHAQDVSEQSGDVSPWRRFTTEHFVTKDKSILLDEKYRAKFDKFVSQQKDAEAAVKLIGPVLREVAVELNTSTETGQFLQRFLNHDGAAAYLYTHELRGRLHPQVGDLGEAFSQIFVRNAEGVFVIRPARLKTVELRLANIERFQPMLRPFHEELKEWSTDLADRDERHRKLKAMLADPHFALFLSGQQIAQFLSDRGMMASSAPSDAQFEDYFYRLEEATNDAPAGLVLNQDSEALQELEHEVARFAAVQQNRETLERPRRELIEQLKQGDELHDKLKTHLKTELAFMIMIQEMDYSPISANGAAREWLANFVTQGTDGKYTINEEAKDEVLSRCQDFFQQFREFRRRGRMMDEFARGLQDRTLAASFQTMTGKLLLQDLVEGSSKRSDVDGLQVWVNTFFEETSNGLRLLESAEGELDTILSEAGELESQLSKNDF